LPRARRPVGSRLVFGSSRQAVESFRPLQLIGLISGVITGVTAGAMGFIGAAAFITGLRFAAFLAGFFFAAFLEDFFFAAFFEDFFFAAFFLEVFFTARFLDFLEDFFLADFLADFFFAAFFFAAMFNSFQCWTDVVVPIAPAGFSALPSFRFASNEIGEAILCAKM
jgi:hypothetical protein